MLGLIEHPENLSATVLAISVLGISLLGSGHCALMCGGLATVLLRGPWQHAAYQAGRLAGYLGLGALLGWIGQGLLVSGLGTASIAAAVLLLAFLGLGQTAWGRAKSSRLHVQAVHFSLPKIVKAALIGLLTAILPCGWLYAALAAAVAVQSPTRGALVLCFFWLGALPALSLAPVLLRRFLSPARVRLSWWLSAVVMLLSLTSVLLRIAPSLAQQPSASATCPLHPE